MAHVDELIKGPKKRVIICSCADQCFPLPIIVGQAIVSYESGSCVGAKRFRTDLFRRTVYPRRTLHCRFASRAVSARYSVILVLSVLS